MIIKISPFFIQWLLTIFILLLLAINIVPAWHNYQARVTLTSEIPSESSLAEHYISRGDWPASKDNNSAINHYQQYLIKTDKTDKTDKKLPTQQ